MLYVLLLLSALYCDDPIRRFRRLEPNIWFWIHPPTQQMQWEVFC